jgi:hypothetical protein
MDLVLTSYFELVTRFFHGSYTKKNGNRQDQWEADEFKCWFQGSTGIECLRILDFDRKVF